MYSEDKQFQEQVFQTLVELQSMRQLIQALEAALLETVHPTPVIQLDEEGGEVRQAG